MNQIEQELNAARTLYMLETEEIEWKEEKKEIVLLTADNVARVEAMIHNDSNYLNSGDKEKMPIIKKSGKIKYGGSVGYWLSQLKKSLSKESTEKTFEEIIEGTVSAVDRENSTHLNADITNDYKGGRKEITDRIIGVKNLQERLRNRDFNLIREIAQRTNKDKGRINLSFASKFCHYACFYLFEGTEYQDNFSIYDNVLSKAIPYYANHYGLEDEYKNKPYIYNPMKKRTIEDVCEIYENYSALVDTIRAKAREKYKYEKEISRNGFDHLLWYYFKGRL